MKKFVFVATALFAATAALPATAQQTPSCTKRPEIVGQLAKQYSEAPVAIGLSSSGGVVEVLSSKKNKSWTMIITMPDGNTCLMAAGEHWETVKTAAKLDPGA
jgi:hypothetical protein